MAKNLAQRSSEGLLFLRSSVRIRLPAIFCVMVICGSNGERSGFTPGLKVRPRDTPHQWVRTNFGLAQTTELTGQKTVVVNGVVVGLFEEEEEGTGIASDVVKVQGKDLTTPGPLI